jgi:hypothetical protein
MTRARGQVRLIRLEASHCSPTRVSSLALEGTEDRRWNGSSRATTPERIGDAEHSFATESAFIGAAEDLLRNVWEGFVSALPDGTIVRDEPALRALIAASTVGR